MIVSMTFFGIGPRPLALSDAVRWVAQYANRHDQRQSLTACVDTATRLVQASK